MSRSTESDICRNILWIGSWAALHEFYEDIYENNDDDDEVNHPFKYGWTWTGSAVSAGKKKRLYADEFSKEVDDTTYKIFIINSSFYESVGECDYNIFSNDLVAVELFKQDFIEELEEIKKEQPYYSLNIEDMDSIEQTL